MSAARVEQFPVHVVYETTDDRGMRGRMVGIFEVEEEAKQAAAGKGWYGGPGSIEYKPAIRVGGLSYLLAIAGPVQMNVNLIDSEKAEIAAAKAKLTERELALLGVK